MLKLLLSAAHAFWRVAFAVLVFFWIGLIVSPHLGRGIVWAVMVVAVVVGCSRALSAARSNPAPTILADAVVRVSSSVPIRATSPGLDVKHDPPAMGGRAVAPTLQPRTTSTNV